MAQTLFKNFHSHNILFQEDATSKYLNNILGALQVKFVAKSFTQCFIEECWI
jgi:hypothetical protein